MPSPPCSTKSCGCVPSCHLFQFWGAAYVSKTEWNTHLREGLGWRNRGNNPWKRTSVLCYCVPICVSMNPYVISLSYCFGIIMLHHFCNNLQYVCIFWGRMIYGFVLLLPWNVWDDARNIFLRENLVRNCHDWSKVYVLIHPLLFQSCDISQLLFYQAYAMIQGCLKCLNAGSLHSFCFEACHTFLHLTETTSLCL